jgi:hypothetical protein
VLAGTLSSPSISVSTGARLSTLSGSTVAAVATISGSHDFGSSPAAATFSNGLTYSSTSDLTWALNQNTTALPGTNFDQLAVTGGNLTIASGAQLALVFNKSGSLVDWSNTFWDTNRQWQLLNFSGTGSSTGNFTSLTISTDSLGQTLASIRSGASFSVNRIGNDLFVDYIIPEPSTLPLLLLALFAFGVGRKNFSRPRAKTGNTWD